METEATRLRTEIEKRIETLKAEIEANKIKVVEAEKVVMQTEQSEKTKVVAGTIGGRTAMLAALAKARVEELRMNLITVRRQRDALSDRIGELEETMNKLREEYNPNFNDEGVKKAVRAWEDYIAKTTDGKNADWSEAEDRDLDVILKQDSETDGVNWADWEGGEHIADDGVALAGLIAYLPPSLRSWTEGALVGLRKVLVENGILPDNAPPPADQESKNLQDARNALSAARSAASTAENELRDKKNDLNDSKYGPDDVFRALQGQCVSKDAGEYTYELCFLTQTKQKPKKGGSETNMGNFVRIDSEFVDDEIDARGRGLGKGHRIVLKYENGQHCWNGPNRRTDVVLACAEKDEIWKVSESEKCVYRMELGSAAACSDSRSTLENRKKDEL